MHYTEDDTHQKSPRSKGKSLNAITVRGNNIEYYETHVSHIELPAKGNEYCLFVKYNERFFITLFVEIDTYSMEIIILREVEFCDMTEHIP